MFKKEYGPYGPQGPWAHKTKMGNPIGNAIANSINK